jgi:DNA-binding NtrC family response regulator
MSAETKAASILVTDDEWGMREGVRRILISGGYDVDSAECGQDALKLVSEKSYDLYLLDLKLPDIDGLSLLAKIQEHDKLAVCIVVSAYANIETAMEATRRGAFDFLAKPFTPDQLRIVVRRGS